MLIFIVMFLAIMLWTQMRQKKILMYFQQHEYDGWRFLKWLFVEHVRVDIKVTCVLVFVALVHLLAQKYLLLVVPASYAILQLVVTALFLYLAKVENKKSENKKPLVLTKRAKRILWTVSAVNVAVLLLLPNKTPNFILFLIFFVQCQPVALVVANMLLFPFEKREQSRFRSLAQDKLKRMDVVTIGITGSFGKTSLKHILGHVLSSLDNSYMTPGSVNTEMGVTRAIREGLLPGTKLFIVEMGAYARGSINKLCKLAPPDLAIVTAIGPAHYERFRSLDEVALAKSELAHAALTRGGTCYLGKGVGQYTPFKDLTHQYADRMFSGVVQKRVKNLTAKHSLEGLGISCELDGMALQIQVPIFGLHQVENILLAILVSFDLGYELKQIVGALRSLKQVQHRLEVKEMASGLTWIDDGFNSNPKGFTSALEFMTEMRDLKHVKKIADAQKLNEMGHSNEPMAVRPGKRYLITPGMVELGDEHERLHRELGEVAKRHVDVLLAVCPQRIPTFVEEFEKSGNPVYRFTSFQAACHFFLSKQSADDVVLIENDLPDLYESPPNF